MIFVIIMLSDIQPKIKLFILLIYTEIANLIPANLTKNRLGSKDRVIILNNISSLIGYFQITAIILENNILSKPYIALIVGTLLIHMLSLFNYLKNEAINIEDKYIFPDWFKFIIVGSMLLDNKF